MNCLPENAVNWCGRRESNRGRSGLQAFAAQAREWLALYGAVAPDAQAEAADLAVRVLGMAELEAHIRAWESAPLPKLQAGAGVSPVSAERVADRASSGAPGDTSDASREFASSAPSKPVCSVCEVCGGESAFDLTFCAHCSEAVDVRAQEGRE